MFYQTTPSSIRGGFSYDKFSLETASSYFRKFARIKPHAQQTRWPGGSITSFSTKKSAKLINFLDGELVTDLPGDFDRSRPRN